MPAMTGRLGDRVTRFVRRRLITVCSGAKILINDGAPLSAASEVQSLTQFAATPASRAQIDVRARASGAAETAATNRRAGTRQKPHESRQFF